MLYREMLYLHSHKKVCGYQNWTFALGVFECLDTYSRKSLFFASVTRIKILLLGKKIFTVSLYVRKLPRFMQFDYGTKPER